MSKNAIISPFFQSFGCPNSPKIVQFCPFACKLLANLTQNKNTNKKRNKKMATSIKLYLDKRNQKKDGTYSLKLSIAYRF